MKVRHPQPNPRTRPRQARRVAGVEAKRSPQHSIRVAGVGVKQSPQHSQQLGAPVGRPQPPCHTQCVRDGLTLYEIVLSLTIFTLAMAAISQLITLGTRASIQAQLQTEAAIRAENKMSEVVAGYYPLSSVSGEADPNDASWMWGLEVADAADVSGTKELTVTVTHLAQSGEPDVVFTLKRLMLDPQLYFDAALEEEEKTEAQSETDGSTGGTP